MTTATDVTPASRLPGPPELLPGCPDAIVDLQTDAGAALVGAQWRYADAEVQEIDFVDVADHLGPGEVPNRTYDVVPHAQAPDFDDVAWRELAPAETMLRLGNGRVSFNWYRLTVTIPKRLGDFDPSGSTAIFEIVIDDYAEVWVDGKIPLALGNTGGEVVGGFNAPNRVVLGHDVHPGQTFHIAVFGINGPISTSPQNYIWVRSASVDFYAAPRVAVGEEVPFEITAGDPRLDEVMSSDARLERVATGFEFTEGPVWSRDGALLFSSPNTNAIYRWTPDGRIEVFRSKSGYTGVDIGRYHQPGSNGLTFDPQEGRLTICQHGNRRVIRVEPHGNITVLADAYEGRRLNSPNDLVYRSDGTLYFTDPPFGLPGVFGDPDKQLEFSGVFGVRPGGGVFLVDDELEGPNGLAFSADERTLYVGNWDEHRKIIKRYDVLPDGTVSGGEIFFDMTGAPGDDALDGLKVDVAGNVYACGPGGLWILSPDGDRLATIALPEDPHNLAWGDADACTLYICALTSVYRLRLNIPGIRPG